jgi:1,4-alpha-glucan branching enzyme
MGFANDFYDYLRLDPFYRKYKHTALNFPITYAFSENFCLPISHDEVVHGKKSFIDKMHGEYEDKFLEARCALMLIMTYPGKKLMFMGTEYAQFREWDFENSLEWFMLDFPNHKYFRDYVAALNDFYLTAKPLWEVDFDFEGFEWILADESSKNTVVYKRIDSNGDYLVVAINFSGETQRVKVCVEKSLRLKCLFDTGNLPSESRDISVENNEDKFYANIILPRFSGGIYKVYKNKNYKKI